MDFLPAGNWYFVVGAVLGCIAGCFMAGAGSWAYAAPRLLMLQTGPKYHNGRYVFMYLCTHACMYVFICVCICICMYTYICIYIYPKP